MQITKKHLAFVQEAIEVFEDNPLRETCRSEDESLIALRMGEDRDCIEIYELSDYIANFVQQMDPNPKPRKPVMEFAHDMEKQLKVNDDKGGWNREHHQDLSGGIFHNLEALRRELIKIDKDKNQISKRCANIANFAMMIADNEGEHL